MYNIGLHPKVDKELAKLPKELRKGIRDVHLKKISIDPYKNGIPLKGALKGFFKYSIGYEGNQCRLVFEVFEDRSLVVILMAGKREKFYERLKRRIGS